jgi:hypothetical protein
MLGLHVEATMDNPEIVRQLNREIEATQESVAFWTKQVRLQERTPAEASVRHIAKSHEIQLQRIRNAQLINFKA